MCINELDLDRVSRLEQDAFIDEELREHFADLIFRVPLLGDAQGRVAFIYVLFEHKSQPEPLVAFQLLRYMVRKWERSAARGRGTLPIIIPLVVYHGAAGLARAAHLW